MAKNITIKGTNLLDENNRAKALQTIQNNASTPALEFLAELVVKKGASEKLLSKKFMIKTFF